MARRILWRLARALLAVWLVASGVFLLSRRDAARAVQLALPEAADLAGHAGWGAARQLAQRTIAHRLGFDQPLFYATRDAGRWRWHGPRNQYHAWLRQALHGDLGHSFRTGEAVTARLAAGLAYTLPLTGLALVLTAAAALALGQRLAARPWWQRPVRVALAGLQALPLFVVAVALLLAFANPEALLWFPASGLALAEGESAGNSLARVSAYVSHLALPVAALVLTALPELALTLDAALTQERRAGYATTARAKGLAESAVIRQHALRNALLPAIAQFTALLPTLVGGAVVVEVVFALPGMGRLLAGAAAGHDYPVLVGGVLLTGAARVLALLLADLLYFWADPRIRWPN